MTDFPLFPEAASTVAGQVDALYLFLVAVSAFFTVLIAASVVYCAVRFRRRDPDEVGGTFHANTLLEVTWTIIPLGIVLFVFFWGARVFFTQYKAPADAVEYTAIAKQWMWHFQHPEGQREINTLHVPVGQPIKITMISQDVIHSLFLPAFRVKQDVLPGRYTQLWFEATKPGSYHLFCTEYCGTEHAQMIGQVVAMEPEAYEAWLAGGAGPPVPPVEAGRELFSQLLCDTCHLDAGGSRGPSLVGLYGETVALAGGGTVVADDGYLRESILDPAARIVEGYQPIMPSFQGQIGEENLFKLIAYVKSLGAPQAEPPAGDGQPRTSVPGGEPTTTDTGESRP
ncbi:MAG TPA: cytochrome c oxidase subunit II [Thermoanaerobaculia bacterium]|nr:cytochrome c oxidase subunit II [Thermoanaerobaculia bacterium]